MANRDKGEVGLTLGGTTYTFKLGTAALIELQELCSTPELVVRQHAEAEARRLHTALMTFGRHAKGCAGSPCACGFAAALAATPTRPSVASIEDIIAEVTRGRLKYVRAFLWAGLQTFHPGTTLGQVDELLDSADEAEVRKLLHQLGLTTAPDPVDVEELRKGVAGNGNPPKARATRARGTGGSSSSRRAASV